MKAIIDAMRKLLTWRRRIETPADLSTLNLKQAQVVIDFVGSPHWEEYRSYIDRKMARAIEDAFGLLDTGSAERVVTKLAEARAYHSFLKDVDASLFALRQEQRRLDKPLSG